jgi:hypothetical protein
MDTISKDLAITVENCDGSKETEIKKGFFADPINHSLYLYKTEYCANKKDSYHQEIAKDSGGYFLYKNGKRYYYPYIFSEKNKNLNLFPSVLEDIKESQDGDDFLSDHEHLYFSFMRSSQALAFNFLDTLKRASPEDQLGFAKKLIELINQNAIGGLRDPLPSDCRIVWDGDITKYLESGDDKKKANAFATDDSLGGKDQSTEIDMVVKLYSPSVNKSFTLLFEVKYSESEIGAAKRDETHIKKFKSCYQSTYGDLSEQQQKDFFKNYQFFRNIRFTYNQSNIISIFLTPSVNFNPSINESIKKACLTAFNEIVPSKMSRLCYSFAQINWEDLLSVPTENEEIKEITVKYFNKSVL